MKTKFSNKKPYLTLIYEYRTITWSTINKLLRFQRDYDDIRVPAIGLFIALGHPLSQWKEWIERHFIQNQYANKGSEYFGEPDQDYFKAPLEFTISISFAMHIAMIDNRRSSRKVYMHLKFRWIANQSSLRHRIDALLKILKELSDGELTSCYNEYPGTPEEFIQRLESDVSEIYDKFYEDWADGQQVKSLPE